MRNKIVIIFVLFLFYSCKNTETYKIAENYLKQDSLLISKFGKDIDIGGIVLYVIRNNDDVDDEYPYDSAYVLYELPIKGKNNDKYIRTFVFLKKEVNKWVGDTIIYDPDQETIIKVYEKYDL